MRRSSRVDEERIIFGFLAFVFNQQNRRSLAGSEQTAARRPAGVERGLTLVADGLQRVRHHAGVDLGTAEVDADDEQPELLLFAAVPRVRHLVVAVLVARVHPHWDRLRRYHFEGCISTSRRVISS